MARLVVRAAIARLYADATYHSAENRRLCAAEGILRLISQRGEPHGSGPAIPPRRPDAPVAGPDGIYNNRHLVENRWARLKDGRALAGRSATYSRYRRA